LEHVSVAAVENSRDVLPRMRARRSGIRDDSADEEEKSEEKSIATITSI